MDAKILRQPMPRHIVGAENNVPEREESGEIFIDGRRVLRVMPAMEDGRRDHGAQRPEIPVHVGMQEDGVKSQEAGDPQRNRGIIA